MLFAETVVEVVAEAGNEGRAFFPRRVTEFPIEGRPAHLVRVAVGGTHLGDTPSASSLG
jgi:hypothetical protein